MNWIEHVEEELKNLLTLAAEKSKETDNVNFETMPDFVIECPRERSHGDYATNIAMMLTKMAKMPPRKIAEAIVKNLPENSLISSVEIAGPGFINFHLDENWLNTGLKNALEQGENFGRSNAGAGKKVQVEFVSANPTGELHMGNARGAAIGDTLANLLSAAGYEVQKEFYVNDAGNQIEKFGESLYARYLQQLGEEAEFPEDGYHGEDIIRTMHEFVEENGDKHRNLPEEELKKVLVDYALDKKITAIRQGLERFGVHYDVWFSEKTLHESGAVLGAIDKLKAQGNVFEKEDAVWFDGEKFGLEKPEVLVRANGIPTYYAADIAYHLNKFDRGFTKLINVWGADHHGHVERLKKAITAAGYPGDQVEVVLMQLVHLISNGEVVRMSKRAGTYVTLEELMDDVGVDAARFFFVMRNADSQMDFDLDLAKKQSADNPVFYVQYAHARICSILRQAEENSIDFSNIENAKLELLHEESEQILMRKILELPNEIRYAAEHSEPHRMAQYAMDLAGLFHSFYNNCRVLGVESDLQVARLLLCKATVQAIRNVLKLMGVTAPEKM